MSASPKAIKALTELRHQDKIALDRERHLTGNEKITLDALKPMDITPAPGITRAQEHAMQLLSESEKHDEIRT